jgi:hypothetical protein
LFSFFGFLCACVLEAGLKREKKVGQGFPGRVSILKYIYFSSAGGSVRECAAVAAAVAWW